MLSVLPAPLVALLALLGQSCDSGFDCDFAVESCIDRKCASRTPAGSAASIPTASAICRGGRCCRSNVDTNCTTCGDRGFCEECSGDLYADGSFATGCTAKKAGGEYCGFSCGDSLGGCDECLSDICNCDRYGVAGNSAPASNYGGYNYGGGGGFVYVYGRRLQDPYTAYCCSSTDAPPWARRRCHRCCRSAAAAAAAATAARHRSPPGPSYSVTTSGSCTADAVIADVDECHEAAVALGLDCVDCEVTVSPSSAYPPGCVFHAARAPSSLYLYPVTNSRWLCQPDEQCICVSRPPAPASPPLPPPSPGLPDVDGSGQDSCPSRFTHIYSMGAELGRYEYCYGPYMTWQANREACAEAGLAMVELRTADERADYKATFGQGQAA